MRVALSIAGFPAYEAAIFVAHSHDIWGAMAKIQAPVRIFRAERPSTCAIFEAKEFTRPTGQAQMTTVPGAPTSCRSNGPTSSRRR